MEKTGEQYSDESASESDQLTEFWTYSNSGGPIEVYTIKKEILDEMIERTEESMIHYGISLKNEKNTMHYGGTLEDKGKENKGEMNKTEDKGEMNKTEDKRGMNRTEEEKERENKIEILGLKVENNSEKINISKVNEVSDFVDLMEKNGNVNKFSINEDLQKQFNTKNSQINKKMDLFDKRLEQENERRKKEMNKLNELGEEVKEILEELDIIQQTRKTEALILREIRSREQRKRQLELNDLGRGIVGNDCQLRETKKRKMTDKQIDDKSGVTNRMSELMSEKASILKRRSDIINELNNMSENME